MTEVGFNIDLDGTKEAQERKRSLDPFDKAGVFRHGRHLRHLSVDAELEALIIAELTATAGQTSSAADKVESAVSDRSTSLRNALTKAASESRVIALGALIAFAVFTYELSQGIWRIEFFWMAVMLGVLSAARAR